tara:strand:+ start:417 stop:935 length:519 start_codon:yes stop_codon:yes gene_type:complete
MTNLIRFKHRKEFARGEFVAGPSGRKYLVDPNTCELHLVSVKGNVVSDSSGVLPEDAKEFSAFGKMFRRVSAAPVAPPVKKAAPPPPPAKPKAQASEVGKEGSPDRPDESASLADSLPNDNNYLTIKEWLDLARNNGIALSKSEKGTRPKAKLIALIREKAGDKPPVKTSNP